MGANRTVFGRLRAARGFRETQRRVIRNANRTRAMGGRGG